MSQRATSPQTPTVRQALKHILAHNTHNRAQANFANQNLMQTNAVDLPVLYFGTPVALISSVNPDGTTNLSPISSYWALSDTFMVGLGTEGRCYRNLLQFPEAVLNLPDARLWTHVETIAATTGAQPVPDYKKQIGYEFEHDKFRRAGLTRRASETVRPERVAECPVQIEARVVRMHEIGNGNDAMVAAELKALRVHVHSELLTPAGRIDLERWQPLHYVFRHYYTLGACLGKNFRA